MLATGFSKGGGASVIWLKWSVSCDRPICDPSHVKKPKRPAVT